ncbi:auxin transport protein BIG [Tanacetum coccineum]
MKSEDARVKNGVFTPEGEKKLLMSKKGFGHNILSSSALEMLVPGHAVGNVMGRGRVNVGNIRKGKPEQKRTAESLNSDFHNGHLMKYDQDYFPGKRKRGKDYKEGMLRGTEVQTLKGLKRKDVQLLRKFRIQFKGGFENAEVGGDPKWALRVYVNNDEACSLKIIKRADERECDPLELSVEFCQEFLTDMADLQCLPPTVQPRVSDHMTMPFYSKGTVEAMEEFRRFEEEMLQQSNKKLQQQLKVWRKLQGMVMVIVDSGVG